MKRFGKHSRWWINYPSGTAHPMHSGGGAICATPAVREEGGYETDNVRRAAIGYRVCHNCLNIMDAQERREQTMKHSWYEKAYKKAKHTK